MSECSDLQHKFLVDAVRQFLEAEDKEKLMPYLVRAYEACK